MAPSSARTPRDYTQKTPKKMKAAALRGALSDRAREGRVHVVSAFVDGDAPKTKAALATLTAVTQAKRVLIVLDRDDVLNWVSLRNVPQVHLIEAGQLNTYDVLVADEVVFTETALAEYVEGRPRARAGVKPDLATREIPGGIPSIAPAEGEGTVETGDRRRGGAGQEGRRQEGSGQEGGCRRSGEEGRCEEGSGQEGGRRRSGEEGRCEEGARHEGGC